MGNVCNGGAHHCNEIEMCVRTKTTTGKITNGTVEAGRMRCKKIWVSGGTRRKNRRFRKQSVWQLAQMEAARSRSSRKRMDSQPCETIRRHPPPRADFARNFEQAVDATRQSVTVDAQSATRRVASHCHTWPESIHHSHHDPRADSPSA